MSRAIARHRRFNAAASRAKTLRPIAGRIRCAGRAAGARVPAEMIADLSDWSSK